MRRFLLATTLAVSFAAPASASGVPTFDGTQLAQLVKQLDHMVKDFNLQLEQVLTLKKTLETQLSQLLNLDAQLKSLIQGSGLGELFATVEEFRRLKGSILRPITTLENIANGEFLKDVRAGFDIRDSIESALMGSGFTTETLASLSASPEPADRGIARQAGAGAMLSVAAEESHAAAGESLARLQSMVGLIDKQDGLKAAVDLNTRVTAELGIILTQIWRLEAAQGVNAGQLGIVDAATLAAERKFRSMAVEK